MSTSVSPETTEALRAPAFPNLSEAIRLGSVIRPRQVFRKWYDGEDGACTGGAAFEAVGRRPAVENWLRELLALKAMYGPSNVPPIHIAKFDTDVLPKEWLPLRKLEASCPACSYDHDVFGTMFHLNDVHECSREGIAGWIEKQERRLRCLEADRRAEAARMMIETLGMWRPNPFPLQFPWEVVEASVGTPRASVPSALGNGDRAGLRQGRGSCRIRQRLEQAGFGFQVRISHYSLHEAVKEQVEP